MCATTSSTHVCHITINACVPHHHQRMCATSPSTHVCHITINACVPQHHQRMCATSPSTHVCHIIINACVPHHHQRMCATSPSTHVCHITINACVPHNHQRMCATSPSTHVCHITINACVPHHHQRMCATSLSTHVCHITINACVPQGTNFGLINDLRTTCEHVKCVGDCTIWESGAPSCVNSSLQTAADEVAQWTITNNMALNFDKTKEMRICFKKETPDIPPITINDIQIEQVHSTRLLGVTISQHLTWQLHIDDITTKASRRLYFVILLKRAGIEPHHLVKHIPQSHVLSSNTPIKCGIPV